LLISELLANGRSGSAIVCTGTGSTEGSRSKGSEDWTDKLGSTLSTRITDKGSLVILSFAKEFPNVGGGVKCIGGCNGSVAKSSAST
jgi:hypothetical protein